MLDLNSLIFAFYFRNNFVTQPIIQKLLRMADVMGRKEKDHVNTNLDTNKNEKMNEKKYNETVTRIMSVPAAQYFAKKIEEFLAILEKTFSWPVSQTNNNVKEQIYDFKMTTEADIINLRDANLTSVGWFFLFPTVFFFHLCHFYINITLFMFNKPPVEFQDIIWTLRHTRFQLKDLRKQGCKMHRHQQKSVAQKLTQNSSELNFPCRIFSRGSLNNFVKRVQKILNFLGIIIMPLDRDFKTNSVNNHHSIEENSGPTDSSKDTSPTPVKTRRVSVTIQEVIFEENEDVPTSGYIKEN